MWEWRVLFITPLTTEFTFKKYCLKLNEAEIALNRFSVLFKCVSLQFFRQRKSRKPWLRHIGFPWRSRRFFFSFFNFSGENRRAREINKNIRNESYGYTRRLTGCEQFINQMYILTDNDVRQKYRAILFITSLKRNACSTLMSLSFHAISIK